MSLVLGPLFHPARDASAHGEDQGGDQEQPRHQHHERCGGRDQQNIRAEKASDNARRRERYDYTSWQAAKLVAIGPDAGRLSRPKRDRVGGVGFHGWNADEQQRGKGDEASAAGNRIDASGDESSDEENRRVRNVHKRRKPILTVTGAEREAESRR